MGNYDFSCRWCKCNSRSIFLLPVIVCAVLLGYRSLFFIHESTTENQKQDQLFASNKGNTTTRPLFKDIVLWSSDFHISPIADIKDAMKEFGVKVIDKSLSGH